MESDYLPLLGRQNVWWEGKIENDPHILQWKKHEFRWVPFNLEELPLNPFSLNIVIGPRQTGKTTLMKFAVETLLKAGVPPKSILYARCDEIIDAKQLRGVVDTFFAYANSKDVFVFLDEITEINGWEKVIKGFVDDGDFKEAVVTVSGSNAFQLQRGSELFPGRRGNGKDVFVLPLSFREYVKTVDAYMAKKIPAVGDLHTLSMAEIEKLLPFQDSLQKHLHDYFQCGGFPLAVMSYLKEGRVSEASKEAYLGWVIGDILKSGKSEVLGREILKVILSKAPSPVSWESIAQETSIKSPPTVASYVELLERLFVVLPLYTVNPNNGTKEFAKNKKLHLQDPFLWHLCEEWCMQTVERKTEVIAEACLASHLARFLFKKYGGWRLGDYLSYWKNDHEIDTVAHTKKGLLGFEMKWSNREAAFKPVPGPIKKTVYVSKNFFRKSPPEAIPLALFLSML